jgi:hypothetical protein
MYGKYEGDSNMWDKVKLVALAIYNDEKVRLAAKGLVLAMAAVGAHALGLTAFLGL